MGGRGRGQVTGDGEGGGGPEMAVAEAVPQGEVAQGRRQEARGEGVAGSGGGHDVHGEGGYEKARCGGRAGVGLARRRRVGVTGARLQGRGAASMSGSATGRDRPPLGRIRDECRGPPAALLHHQYRRLGQHRPDRGRPSLDPPRLLRLVLPHEHDVRLPGQLQQHPRTVRVPPQAGPVVHVEGDKGPFRSGSRQLQHQLKTGVRQGRRDPREVQHPPRPHRRQVHVLDRHRRSRRPRPVVRHFMRIGGPVPRRTEVHPRGPRRITTDRGDIDAVPSDRLDQVVPEPVGPDPADPPHRMPGGSQSARDVRLRAPDRPVEGRHVGEATGTTGQERDHGLAERDDVHGVVGIHDGRSSFIDPALAWMLDSSKRYTQ